METRNVTLELSATRGLGFSLLGGSEVPQAFQRFGVVVTQVHDNGAASFAGILPGDRIVAVNGQTLEGLAHAQVVALLKDCTGTVTMKTERDSIAPGKVPFQVAPVAAAASTTAKGKAKGTASPDSVVHNETVPDDWQRLLNEGKYAVGLGDMIGLIAERSENGIDRLETKFHGVGALAKALRSDIHVGISGDDLTERRNTFGANCIPAVKPKNIFQLMWEAIQDATLVILLICATISLVLGATVGEEKKTAWIDGLAILVSVVIVVMVTAVNDFQKERQFQGLQAKQDSLKVAHVFRNGTKIQVPVAEVVVGDLLEVEDGNILPADGVLIEGYEIECDESALTGESEAIAKSVSHMPWMLSGTSVQSGSGKMLVTCVGLFSEEGIINRLITGAGEKEAAVLEAKDRKAMEDVTRVAQALEAKNQASAEELSAEEAAKRDKEKAKRSKKKESILQGKLGKMAINIGKCGTVVAIFTVFVLLLRFGIEDFGINGRSWDSGKDWNKLLEFLIIGITVLVVAVPEGLPLAVAIALAYSVKKMQRDQNLVRILAACETMGNATTICSDKTGTLTMNRMNVIRAYANATDFTDPAAAKTLPPALLDPLIEGLCVNTSDKSAYRYEASSPYPIQDGNKTECACLEFSDKISASRAYAEVQQQATLVKQFKFDHRKKRMVSVIRLADGTLRVLVKGASEIILRSCGFEALADGPRALTPARRAEIEATVIDRYAELALRVIMVAYRDVPAGTNLDDDEPLVRDLVISCLVGIQDPERPEVPAAIQTCLRAGVVVRMVTGDNKITARAIAINCGLITPGDDFLVMEGPEFRRQVVNADGSLNYARLSEIWPKLRVMARCSPTDKYNLVRGLIHDGEVVAVTGDGTNDGPALAEADVGFAMGSGTQVAQQASDIVILDDNFRSMVAAISWGRNVYDSIAKFLTFQLTVNIVAITVAFVGAASIKESPLRAIQLLWVNLIMDSFASLALATEPPMPELLLRQPYKRNSPLLSRIMIRQMLGHAVYQLAVVFTLLYAGDKIFNIPSGRNRDHNDPRGAESQHFTMVFNAFVWMQIFNEINSRKIHDEINVFKGFLNNPLFLIIIIGTMGAQAILIEFGQKAFHTTGLSVDQWFACIIIGAFSLVWNVIIHYIFPWQWIPEFLVRPSEPKKKKGEAAAAAAEVAAVPSIVQTPAVGALAGRERLLNDLWGQATARLRQQIRIVNMFRDAGQAGLRRRVTGQKMLSLATSSAAEEIAMTPITQGERDGGSAAAPEAQKAAQTGYIEVVPANAELQAADDGSTAV